MGKYKKHIKSHEDDRRFKCKECPSTFNLEKNLRLHFATHDPVDLICPECNRAFSRLASFKSHLTIHEEEVSTFREEILSFLLQGIFCLKYMICFRTIYHANSVMPIYQQNSN